MPDFRRYFVPGGTYFFTVVTASRHPLFKNELARTLLGRAMREQRAEAPFETVAIVLLPDHLHAIWTLPVGDDHYSRRWQAIKARFTSEWLASGGTEQSIDSRRHDSFFNGGRSEEICVRRCLPKL
jgi:putative transposase